MRWTRLTLRAPAAREEDLAALLAELGTLGLEVKEAGAEWVDLEAYFVEPLPAAVAHLDAAAWRERGAELIGSASVPETDWLAHYRASLQPFAVGRSLLVDPREGSEPPTRDAADRLLLGIPCRTAFGIGSHASTRLALELLEEATAADLEVLDLGTGTGILALAALRLGAAAATALDLDAGTVFVAREAARRNCLALRLAAGTIATLRPGPAFHLALVNMIPAEWLGEAEEVVARLRPGGALITSGLLDGQRALVRDRLAALGMRLDEERRKEEWVGMRFELANA